MDTKELLCMLTKALYDKNWPFFRFTLLDDLTVYLHLINGAKEQCPNYILITGVTAGTLVFLIGLALILMYFCYIKISDRREYARFIRERDNFKGVINSNPLHKPPISEFKNPMYEKKQE